MTKFQTLWELPRQDTEIGSKEMLLEKWCQQTCSTQGCHKLPICKKHGICKANKIKQSVINPGTPVGVYIDVSLLNTIDWYL